MPPKKKKLTPVVVGTVSTRSTRRESIVNIKIIPKASKLLTRSPAPKKTPKKSHQTSSKKDIEEGTGDELEKTSPEILEILKDWSDDENSQEESLLSISSGTRSLIIDKSEHNARSLLVDQQSLIDILEGNNLEPQQPKSIKYPLQQKQESLPDPIKFTLTKELIIENPIVNSNSPQIHDSEIIEECVVEDDSIIIELPEEQMEITSQDCVSEDPNKGLNVNVENISTDKKLANQLVALRLKSRIQTSTVDCNSDNTEQRSRSPAYNMKISKDTYISSNKQNQFDMSWADTKIKKHKDIFKTLQEVQQSGNLDENLKHSSSELDEENQSMTSEDTTSQSMITVQDEDPYDINDIQMSDNSTNNYEVIEEQVVFDTSEPIIIENLENVHPDIQIQRNNLLETNESVLGIQDIQNVKNQPKGEEISSYNQPLGDMKKSFYNDDLSPKDHQNKVSKQDLLPVIQKGVEEKILQSSTNSPKFTPSSLQKSSVKLDDSIGKCLENASTIVKNFSEIISETEVTAHNKDNIRLKSVTASELKDNKNSQNSSIHIGETIKTTCSSHQKDNLENDKQQSIQIPSLEFVKETHSKGHDQYLRTTDIKYQSITNSLDAQSDENTLCEKINELMALSKKSSNIKDFDPASDQLQEGIQKMHIQEQCGQTEITSVVTVHSEAPKKKSTSSVDDIKPFEREIESKNPQLLSMEKKQKESVLTPKSALVDSKTSTEKSLMDSDPHSKKYLLEIDIKHRRRSSRRKPISDEVQQSEMDKQEESAKLQTISDKRTHDRSLDSEIFSTFEISSQDEQCDKQFIVKRKTQHKHVTKMDVDSESSEAKTSEAEGDSTSNESCQSSNSTKMYKTRAKNVLIKHVEELDKMNVESNLRSLTEIYKSDLEIDISTDDNSQNRKSKGTKTKIKKPLKKVVDEEMEKMDIDSDKSPNTCDIKLQGNIDATIDEVLRKYTQDDSGTPEECASPKELKLKVVKHTKEPKKKKEAKFRKDDKYESSEEVRRSDRIKTILPVKKKSHGLVRSKSEPALSVEAESSDSNSVHSEFDKTTPVSPQLNKKYKVKSKAKSSEMLQIANSESLPPENSPQLPKAVDLKADKSGKAEIEARLKSFVHLKENQYKTDRQICKEAREMICDCYLAEEDIQKDEYGCGEDCLNRLLMIECGYLCQISGRCTNKRFQKGQFAPVEVFKTEKKGLGLIAAANIPYGEFILEYIGEVLNPEEFDKRAEVYSKDKNIHFYFMSLRADAIIDATMKGNISRFINHSCDPNAETQKWTVNGELRIGFFSTRTILAGEEITFDYKFQRYGKEAQKCYCGAATCRGWLGERPDESEDEDEEEDEEPSKVGQAEITTAEIKGPTVDILEAEETGEKGLTHVKPIEKMEIDAKAEVSVEVKMPQESPATPQVQETPKKITKKKLRKELLYEDFDQLNEDIEMVVTTGLKNQAHTLKLSRLMVRAKDLDQRKKLLRVLRRGELPCRRLFLDYHGLRLMHGYMIDAQQLTNSDKKLNSQLDFLQTKLELLQTLAVLPIQNKTMLIESKVLPAVEKWAKNEDLVEDSIDQKDVKKSPEEINKQEDSLDPAVNEKIDEIKFLASKLLEEWINMKESFRIPKKQRIEQMKEHEKEANRKFVETSYAQEKESSRKNDQRYRSWSRYKSERETNKKGHREDKDKPSAEYLKMSKHERRKLFALQMELKEEERRLKQREMWRQHEMNCMMIGADPRFTAPFDPSKGFQYIWNPSIGQWQALPVPSAQNQGVYNSPATTQGTTGFNVPPTSQGVSGYNVPPTHKTTLLGAYAPSMLNVPGMPGPAQQYPGMQPNIAPMVPGLSATVSTITSTVPGITASIPGITSLVPGMAATLHGISGPTTVIPGSVPGITQPPLPALPMYPEVKQPEEDPSQVKFAGPIPPPVKLPTKWKCAKDKYGRPYYYHVKVRKSQWEPPLLLEEVEESSDTSSSETSSLSSTDSSSDPDTDDEIDDTKLLMEVRKQMETTSKLGLKSVIPQHVKKEEKYSATPSPEVKIESDNEDEPIEELKADMEEDNSEQLSSIDIRLKEQFNLDSNDAPKKKRRIGLCQEIIISPRTEEDRQQFKEDLKRYKATKEKLKRQKEHMLHQAKKKLKTSSGIDDIKKSREKRLSKSISKSRIRQMEWNDEHAKKIKEVFRSTMATTVVGVLNAYRKPDCKESRITNTEDFKHLARKLTHFVMLKEMKHINTIEELVCTDNVKAKAREYIKKYMSKFGEVYQKRHDEPDFKD